MVSPNYDKYYNTITQFDKNAWVESNCAEIAFLNIGTSNFSVLGFVVNPGFGISFDGQENQLDVTKYQIIFDNTGVNNAAVFRKMYTQVI